MKPLSTNSRADQVDLGDPVSLPVQEYPHERSHVTHVPALTIDLSLPLSGLPGLPTLPPGPAEWHCDEALFQT